jgi:uncharacterized membrane protein
MNPAVILVVLIGIGVLSGFRSLTPIALVSWLAIWGWTPVAGTPFWFIGTQLFAIVVSVLAVLELIADKLPKTPARTHLMPLIARLVTGAISAGALCFSAGRSWILGSVLGAVGALVGTFGGYHVRRLIGARLRIPDFLVALAEDLVTIVGTLLLVQLFFHARV